MKSQIYVLVNVFMITSYAAAFSGFGSGIETDPYIITTVEQLQEIQDDLGAYYVLGNDIDAWETASWNSGEGFVPIGSFTGNFDGRNHAINDLYINRPNGIRVALFGYITNGGSVENVGFINARIFGDYNVGIIAGVCAGNSLIDNCWVSGQVTISSDGDSDSKSGGLLGELKSSVMSRSYSDVNVTALSNRRQIGGLCGYLRGRTGTPHAIIENCYSIGTVSSDGYKVGGLLGDADGINAMVSKCYSVGRVNGSHRKGLIGYNFRNPTILDSYWDKQASGCSSSYGGVGKTTAQMMQQGTFVDWDFDEIWEIDEGQSYPYFREARILEELEIVGPDEVAEDSQVQYKAIGYYDNGSSKDVTGLAVWSVDDEAAATIDENGLLTTAEINRPQKDIIISAEYTADGITKADDKNVTVLAICPSGSALEFDGVDDGVRVPDDNSLNFGSSTDFSIFCWAKYEPDGVKRWNILVDKRINTSTGYVMGINMIQNGMLIFRTSETVKSDLAVSDTEWHHIGVVVERDSDTVTFYLDNMSDTKTFVDGNLDCSADLVIGKRAFSESNHFSGSIDEVVIYSRALSAEDVQGLLYNKPDVEDPCIVGYWDFDDGEGQIATDVSSNGNDGVLGSTEEVDGSDPEWVDDVAPVGICTLEGIVERRLSRVVDTKLNILEQLRDIMLEEQMVVDMLDTYFKNRDFGDVDKKDVVKAKQKIHTAIQHEEQGEMDINRSLGSLEEALSALGSEVDTQSQDEETEAGTVSILRVDINGDGVVDMSDLAEIGKHWLKGY